MRTDSAGKTYAYVAAYVTDKARVGYTATLHWNGKAETFAPLKGSSPFSWMDYGPTKISGCSVTLS